MRQLIKGMKHKYIASFKSTDTIRLLSGIHFMEKFSTMLQHMHLLIYIFGWRNFIEF